MTGRGSPLVRPANATSAGRHEHLSALVLLVVVPLAAHLAFSWMGFDPADEGSTLAVSRRILEGQVPHRDFIIVRPALTPVLHAPVAALGKRGLLMRSRFVVFFEFAFVAWLWTVIVGRALGGRAPPWLVICMGVLGFTMGSHDFIVSAWNTVDGLVLASAGLALSLGGYDGGQQKERPLGHVLAGMALIGAAYLCKQNFFLVGPAAILLIGRAKDWRAWAAWIAPGLAYALWIALAGGLDEAGAQLFAAGELLETGVLPYLRVEVLASLLLGALLTLACSGPGGGGATGRATGLDRRYLTLAALGVIAVGAAALAGGNPAYYPAARLPFAFLAGAAVSLSVRGAWARRLLVPAWLVVVLAWSASVSLGYRTPALASAAVVTTLLALAWLGAAQPGRKPAPAWPEGPTELRASAVGMEARGGSPGYWFVGAVVALTAMALVAYTVGRLSHVYGDAPLGRLSAPLGPLLVGGEGIRTGPNTAALMADFAAARSAAGTGTIAVIPGIAAYWMTSEQRNPLPSDWAQGAELYTPALMERVARRIVDLRGECTFIVCTVEVFDLPTGFTPIVRGYYHTLPYFVMENLDKAGQTRYFALYR